MPRWILLAALGGVLAMAGVDAVMMRRHPVLVQPTPQASGLPPRPSPFHRQGPEIEVTQTLPARVAAARPPVAQTVGGAEPVADAEPPKGSRLGRFLSKIPLLRHLRKHAPADESEPR